MVLAVLRLAHDRGGPLLGNELPWPTAGVHDGLRLGEVGA